MLQAFCSLWTISLTRFSSWETVTCMQYYVRPAAGKSHCTACDKADKHWGTFLKQTLWLTEKIRARGTFNSLSFAEMGYGLSQQLPRGVWVPGPHSDCCTLAWEEVSDVWDTKAALWYVPNMVSCWVFVSWLCLFPYLPPPWGIPLCGIFLCQHSSADNIHVLLNNQ